MIYASVNGILYPAIIGSKAADREWGNRKVLEITVEMTCEEAAVIFVTGVAWSTVRQEPSYVGEDGKTVTPEPVVTDHSEYSVAGPITDHRDGTVTVKMGKPTEAETLCAQLANAVTEEELEAAYVEGVNSL